MMMNMILFLGLLPTFLELGGEKLAVTNIGLILLDTLSKFVNFFHTW